MLQGDVAINLAGARFACIYSFGFPLLFSFFFGKNIKTFNELYHLRSSDICGLLPLNQDLTVYADSSYLLGMASKHRPVFEQNLPPRSAKHYPLCVHVSQSSNKKQPKPCLLLFIHFCVAVITNESVA